MQSIYFLKPMATTILIWVTVWGIEVICIGHTVWGTKDKVKRGHQQEVRAGGIIYYSFQDKYTPLQIGAQHRDKSTWAA